MAAGVLGQQIRPKREKERKIVKQLIHELMKGKNVKSNLEKYKAISVSSYMEYAALELTFSAYTMVQEIMEERPEPAERERRMAQSILELLGDLGRRDMDVETVIPQIRELRQEITERMDVLTCYTDRLLVYEYVLNRMEFKYLSEKELDQKLAAFQEPAYMKKLLAWLFSDRDQTILHEKLRLVIGQIPVHMTRNKFSQRVSEAMTLYKDGDAGALENFIYMIRTAAMVYEPVTYAEEYPEFRALLQQLADADYTGLDETAYHSLAAGLEEGASAIRDITDFYYGLQKVVNGVFAICLLQRHLHPDSESRLVRACRSIWVCLAQRQYRDEMLEPLEGRIEELLEKISGLEPVLMEIQASYRAEIRSAGVASFYEDLAAVSNLLSDSLFVDLDRAVKEEKADAAYVKRRTEELLEELLKKLNEVSRPVRRALMGQVLEKLPLVFENTDEVQEYIQVNLMGCQDKAEKCVVMMILWDLMQEEL